mmetsp:Transcript_10340/g.14596  ORF Transcript_10340/g.14596 Transcript_10340/m.14596 type:complete len:99 (-) Transcript_10340:21-317(-)
MLGCAPPFCFFDFCAIVEKLIGDVIMTELKFPNLLSTVNRLGSMVDMDDKDENDLIDAGAAMPRAAPINDLGDCDTVRPAIRRTSMFAMARSFVQLKV